MSSESPQSDHPGRSRVLLAQIAAYLAAWLIVLPIEWRRWREIPFENTELLGWPASLYWDAPLYLPLLLLAPLAWWCRRRLVERRRSAKPNSQTSWWSADVNSAGGRRSWALAVIVAGVSLAMSAHVGSHFEDLPPGYHDEYSYLLQAKTFLKGRFSFPSHEVPRLFDQVHVLNEGRFASRYFPGTGLWMAPFVAIGHPYWGHWLAGAVTAFFVFWTGRELAGDGAGLTAGLLTALSPGMALFSNMLLAHHPTLVGLSLFLFSFVRWRRRGTIGYALLAGLGLSFAMCCRPMTAAGVGLPFGIAFTIWLCRGERGKARTSFAQRLRFAAALGGTILLGLAAIFVNNWAITGKGLVTPYQLYTDIYTPRHVYGFNNVIRGEEKLGPRVLDNYDRWAENLTPEVAVRNVEKRLIASMQWTLGIVPLVMAGILFVTVVPRADGNAWLIFSAIISLHTVHIPYWYDGIMHWHYVFESGPLWTLVFAAVSARLIAFWKQDDRPWMPVWGAGLVLASLLMTYVPFEPFWDARVSHEIASIRFGRRKHGLFRQLVRQSVKGQAAVVFVEHDPADRHIDYVINEPDLKADVLFARFLPKQYSPDRLHQLFPNRLLLVYHAKTGQLEPLR